MAEKQALSLGAMVYPDWALCPLDEQLAAMRAAGLMETELFFIEKNLSTAQRVAEQVRSAGIRPVSLHAPFSREISLSTLEPLRRMASVAKGLNAVEAAAAAGVETIVFHPANDVRDIPLRGEHAAALTESLKKICAAARTKGLRVAVENMPPQELGSHLVEIVEMVRASHIPNLGICLDTGHANMNGDLIEGVSAAGQFLFALHVHDNDGTKDQHLPVFSGTINWADFLKALTNTGFTGCFMLETGHIFPRKNASQPCLEWIERLRAMLNTK